MKNYNFRKFYWDMFKKYIPYEKLPEVDLKQFTLEAEANLLKNRFAKTEEGKDFFDTCDYIASECEREGYPSHGLNYSLRVESLLKEGELYE